MSAVPLSTRGLMSWWHQVNNAIAERASAIRDYLRDHPDRALVRRYSFVAARFEEMKLAQHDGRTTPDDDARFQEVTGMLRVLGKRLGLGDSVTGWREFLPGDPQRIISDSWLRSARLWFTRGPFRRITALSPLSAWRVRSATAWAAAFMG